MRSSFGVFIVCRGPRYTLIAFSLILLAAVADLRAQESSTVRSGDRVRVAAADLSGEYLVEDLLPDSLVLQQAPGFPDRYVATRSIVEIQVFRGRTSYLTGGLQGAIAGGVMGGLMSIPCQLPHGECGGFPPAERLLAGAGVGALLGMVVRGGREIWERVTVPGQVSRIPPRYAGGSEESSSTRPSGPDYISEAEIRRQTSSAEDAYTLIQRIHPNWMRARMTAQGERLTPDVFVNGAHLGSLWFLRDYTVADLTSVEYVESQTATVQYGSEFLAGIIHLRTN